MVTYHAHVKCVVSLEMKESIYTFCDYCVDYTLMLKPELTFMFTEMLMMFFSLYPITKAMPLFEDSFGSWFSCTIPIVAAATKTFEMIKFIALVTLFPHSWMDNLLKTEFFMPRARIFL